MTAVSLPESPALPKASANLVFSSCMPSGVEVARYVKISCTFTAFGRCPAAYASGLRVSITTHGSFAMNSASSLAEIRTSVMAASPVFEVQVGRGRNSHVRQHFPQLLGGGRHDGDEVGFAEPALRTVAHQVAARAAVEHRRMRRRDARLARTQAQGDDLAPVALLLVVG